MDTRRIVLHAATRRKLKEEVRWTIDARYRTRCLIVLRAEEGWGSGRIAGAMMSGHVGGSEHWGVRRYTALGEDAKEEVIAKVEFLKVFGPQLARPHADTLNGSKYKNMKELRADTRDAVMRIAFALDPERSAILLVGGNKAGGWLRWLMRCSSDIYNGWSDGRREVYNGEIV